MVDLIIEDGTGVEDANSYTDPEDLDNYMKESGEFDTWDSLTENDQNIAVINSSRFLDYRYYKRFIGEPLNDDQGLFLPTDKIDPTNKWFQKAVAQCTLQFISDGEGLETAPDPESNIKKISASLGSGELSETIEYFDRQSETRFMIIDAYIDKALPEDIRDNVLQFPVHRA